MDFSNGSFIYHQISSGLAGTTSTVPFSQLLWPFLLHLVCSISVSQWSQWHGLDRVPGCKVDDSPIMAISICKHSPWLLVACWILLVIYLRSVSVWPCLSIKSRWSHFHTFPCTLCTSSAKNRYPPVNTQGKNHMFFASLHKSSNSIWTIYTSYTY